MCEKALEFQRRVLPANHPDIGEGCLESDALQVVCFDIFSFAGQVLYSISFCYETSGLLPRALQCAREALRIWQASSLGQEKVALVQSQVRRLERALN
jgi:hypothetical protein